MLAAIHRTFKVGWLAAYICSTDDSIFVPSSPASREPPVRPSQVRFMQFARLNFLADQVRSWVAQLKPQGHTGSATHPQSA
jgi:hypothetical protein